eukprot:TRINITY_DN10669_c0_g1_i3.p2 TRINITY_DN10669_c0_g1~~TRINITY_DN10669_c0_g1_i3.p2  ORF type:complete len:218 (-),score=61.10 TRINITY_DN10669_c0_g1_i3:851-1504(-)
MAIDGRSACLSYRTSGDKQKSFTVHFLYLTLEADRDCSFVLKAGFGNARFHKVNESEVAEHVAESRKDLDDSLSFLLPKSRGVKTRSYLNRVKKTFILIKKHRRKVIHQSQKNDQEERLRKFVISHRIELKKKLIEIAGRRLRHVNDQKDLLKFWIYLMKITQMGKALNTEFIDYKKKKTENEMKIFKAIRIYSFLRVRTASNAVGFRKRMHKRIAV